MPRDKAVEFTDDGHLIVVDGRRWRVTDPEIPAEVEARLTSLLMAAPRAVALAGDDREAELSARSRVHIAKIGLGERGPTWWEQPLPDHRRRWEDGLRQLDGGDGCRPGPSGS